MNFKRLECLILVVVLAVNDRIDFLARGLCANIFRTQKDNKKV